ncbi:MAG TPA: hypothetical protein VN258_04960 [Mobilitalea sp.]|nr:hypothetical protein [Mobilitalea sp.]
MDREQKIIRHYLETGVLGAYETAEVIHEEEENGKFAPCFEDATVFFDKAQTSIFYTADSVRRTNSRATPTVFRTSGCSLKSMRRITASPT